MLKMLMEIALPKMGELLVMMMTMISPSRREVPPVESLHQRAKVLLPNFCLEVAARAGEKARSSRAKQVARDSARIDSNSKNNESSQALV